MFSQLRHLVPLEFSLVFLLGDVPSKQFNKILEIIYSQDKFLVCLILVFLIIELFSKKSIFFCCCFNYSQQHEQGIMVSAEDAAVAAAGAH